MANRYWVGGTNTWDATAGTKWALTDGGAGGQDVPTSSDDVFFTATSGTVTVTISASSRCLNLNCTGFTGTIAGTSTLYIYGSLTLNNSMSWTRSAGQVNLAGTGTHTLSTFGKTNGGDYWNVTGTGTYTLLNDFVVNNSFEVRQGTFDADIYNITANSIKLGYITQSCNVYMGSGTWKVAGNTTVGFDILSTATVNLYCETSTLKIENTITDAQNQNLGNKTYYNVWFASHSAGGYFVINGSNIMNELKISPAVDVRFTVGTTQTVNSLDINGDVSNNAKIGCYNLRELKVYSSSITIPDNSLSIIVEAYGGGGAGGGATNTTGQGGGGAGGQYAKKTIDVSAKIGQTFNFTVGGLKAGTTGTGGAGNDSIFYDTDGTTVLVRAKGGAGGQSDVAGGAGGLGSDVDGIGDIVYRGGNGSGIAGSNSGAGGGGSGSTGAGGDASGITSGTGTDLNGGNGGSGRTTGGIGNAGLNSGGGGGGGKATTTTDKAGGNGGSGAIYITIIGKAVISDSSGKNNLTYTTITKMIATGGATFNAFTSNGNVDGGDNIGWNFLSSAQASFLLNMI